MFVAKKHVKKPRRKPVPSEVFVVAWNSSSSLKEVSNKTGIPIENVQSRAANLRYLKDIYLKRLSSKKCVNWEKVKRLARRALKDA